MAEEGKKISFGFSKSIKKPVLQNVAPKEEKKVEYIEFMNENSIKIIGEEKKEEAPLVIPLLGSKTWHDRIINKTDADIFEPKIKKEAKSVIKDEPMEIVSIKQEKEEDVPNGEVSNENNTPIDSSINIKTEPQEDKSLTLEEQAAQEILSDLKSNDNEKKQDVFAVPVADDDLRGKEESTLDDYEKIPIDAFGMAMLRGMGWQPGKGIGKNEKVVPPAIPELRPKGMGLGADKLALQKTKKKQTKEEEQLKLIKGSYVKIIAGKQVNNYGKVEGFDEEAGRLILKLALGGEVITVNEMLVQPVTSAEYSENSKILNVKKYEEYKSNENKNSDKVNEPSSKSSKDDSDEDKRKARSKKSKKRSKKSKHQSSDDDSSVERKSRRRKDSSSSSDEEQRKKSKKSKKHKNRDSSAERSSRKNRKKDKEREKTRHKKSDYSDPSERARQKSRKKSRSRSRSYSPKHRKRARSCSYSPRR